MKRFICLLTALFLVQFAFCQTKNKSLKIGLFAPLYLDSIFNGNNYNYGKKFPRFAVQGIDFVQGAQIALDSFPLEDASFELFIYDTKSDSLPLETLIKNEKLNNLDLIIGAVKDEEFDQLAAFSKENEIPFLSSIYPNDGGVTLNPNLVILNPTLKTHCQSIFSYLLQNQDSAKFLHVRPTGSQEDRVANYFDNLNKQDKKHLINIKTILLDSNYNSIRNQLDSTKNNIIIGGSLDEMFANNLYGILVNTDKKYKITLIGMPNWDGFSSLNKKMKDAPRNIPFIFTSAYYNDKTDSISKLLQEIYLANYKGRPSEYAYKGFEIIYNFTRILKEYPRQFIKHIDEKDYLVFSSYNFLPVSVEKKSKDIDYFENKHLYFLKKSKNGILKIE